VSLFGAASTAHTTGRPKLPGVSTPLVNIDGTLQVGVTVARSSTARASIPVVTINLPQSNVPKVS
jgi:hypothetical protein